MSDDEHPPRTDEAPGASSVPGRSSGRRVLITGASSGLGKGMALALARQGCRLALTGRRPEKLAATVKAVRAAGAECLELLGSVTDPEDVRRHYERIREAWGGLDWAVLNAGVGDSDHALRFRAETYRWTLDTNVMGVAHWLEAVIPDMVKAGRGTIAGIASLAAYRGLPNSGAYSASKAALVTMLESVRVDLSRTGVRVVTVSPGFVRSEMTDRNDFKDMWFLLETEDGVRRILEGVERGDRLVHFPWQLSWFVVYVASVMPSFLYDWIVSRTSKRHKRPYVDESAARR